jgi:sulfur carrier protein
VGPSARGSPPPPAGLWYNPGRDVAAAATRAGSTGRVKVILRHPERREVTVEGRRRVGDLLRELGLAPEAHLVIRENRLLTRDAQLEEADTVEVRPVISGGA